MAISVQMYQWESVAQLYLMHPLFQIFCICEIFCYSTLLYLFWDKYMGLGSSIWGVVGLSHWNGTVSAFCRQNANSFRKSADLQPLLGLGAPAPFGCISNPTFKPFPHYCCYVAKKNTSYVFSRSGGWDLMLSCFQLKQVSLKVSCLQQFIGQSWLLKSLKMEKGGLGLLLLQLQLFLHCQYIVNVDGASTLARFFAFNSEQSQVGFHIFDMPQNKKDKASESKW